MDLSFAKGLQGCGKAPTWDETASVWIQGLLLVSSRAQRWTSFPFCSVVVSALSLSLGFLTLHLPACWDSWQTFSLLGAPFSKCSFGASPQMGLLWPRGWHSEGSDRSQLWRKPKAISQAQTLINNSYWWLSWKRNLPAVQETVFNPWVRKISWRRALATHSIILAWENPIDTGAWWATVPGAAESDTTKQWSPHTPLSERFLGSVQWMLEKLLSLPGFYRRGIWALERLHHLTKVTESVMGPESV